MQRREIKYIITDISGRSLVTAEKFINTSSELTIDLSEMPAGLYIVQVISSDEISTAKFIRQ